MKSEITRLRAEVERLTNLHHTGVGYMKSADEALAALRAEVERKDAALHRVLTKYGYALPTMVKDTLTAALTPSQEKQNGK